MTKHCLPFPSVNGDRKVGTTAFRSLFKTFFTNGIFANPSTNLQVLESVEGNMTTTVKAGRAFIDGTFMLEDQDIIIEHDIAHGLLKRIDRIVVRLDHSLRDMIVVLKKGEFASNPVAPSIQRDAEAYEIVLADVFITNGATRITQANITDRRMDKSLCGVVASTINELDTTTLYNQYQSFWDAWRNQKVNEFGQFQQDAQNAFNAQYQTNQTAFDTQYNNNQTRADNQHTINQNEHDDMMVANEAEFASLISDFSAVFTDWMMQEQVDFVAWFDDLQDMLDGDVAANLAARVLELEKNIANGAGFKFVQDTINNKLSVQFNLNFYIDEDGKGYYVGEGGNATATFENGKIMLWKVM